jgi:hypothetical protein
LATNSAPILPAPRFGQLLTDDARHHVERAAGRERHDEPHRFIRIRGGGLRA